MCAHALKLARVRKVYFILANSKFGGLKSLMSAEGVDFEQIDYRRQEIIQFLKDFYTKGNYRLEPSKRHRKPKKISQSQAVASSKEKSTAKSVKKTGKSTQSRPEFELLGKRPEPPETH